MDTCSEVCDINKRDITAKMPEVKEWLSAEGMQPQ